MSTQVKTKKALLIEDDAFARYAMQNIAKDLGYELTVCGSGPDGLDLLRKDAQSYGVVLMALHMDGPSGIETTKQLRALPESKGRNMPVIAVTAEVTYFDDAIVSKFGMNGFARKPVSPGRLMALFQKYCEAV